MPAPLAMRANDAAWPAQRFQQIPRFALIAVFCFYAKQAQLLTEKGGHGAFAG